MLWYRLCSGLRHRLDCWWAGMGFLMFVLQLLPDVYLDRLSANKAWR